MRRYDFLPKESVFRAFKRITSAFVLTNNIPDIKEILLGITTKDERIKIGRRIQIAEALLSGLKNQEIMEALNVGQQTITNVAKSMENHPRCFQLLAKLPKEYKSEKNRQNYRLAGGSKMIFKKRPL